MPVLLREADRSRWDGELAAHAVRTVEQALRLGRVGPFQLKAAISCLHSSASDVEATDWPQIVQLYRMLEALEPSVPVRVNRAVAEAQVHGPAAGLAVLDTLPGPPAWHLFHAARAELLLLVGDRAAADEAFGAALACVTSEVDRAFLERRRRIGRR